MGNTNNIGKLSLTSWSSLTRKYLFGTGHDKFGPLLY